VIGIAVTSSEAVLAAVALVLFASAVIPLLLEQARLARKILKSAIWPWTNLRAYLADQYSPVPRRPDLSEAASGENKSTAMVAPLDAAERSQGEPALLVPVPAEHSCSRLVGLKGLLAAACPQAALACSALVVLLGNPDTPMRMGVLGRNPVLKAHRLLQNSGDMTEVGNPFSGAPARPALLASRLAGSAVGTAQNTAASSRGLPAEERRRPFLQTQQAPLAAESPLPKTSVECRAPFSSARGGSFPGASSPLPASVSPPPSSPRATSASTPHAAMGEPEGAARSFAAAKVEAAGALG